MVSLSNHANADDAPSGWVVYPQVIDKVGRPLEMRGAAERSMGRVPRALTNSAVNCRSIAKAASFHASTGRAMA